MAMKSNLYRKVVRPIRMQKTIKYMFGSLVARSTASRKSNAKEASRRFWEVETGLTWRPATLSEAVWFEQNTCSNSEQLFIKEEGVGWFLLLHGREPKESGWTPVVPTLFKLLSTASDKKRSWIAQKVEERWGCRQGYNPTSSEKPTMDFAYELAIFIRNFNPSEEGYWSKAEKLISAHNVYCKSFDRNNKTSLSDTVADLMGRKDCACYQLRRHVTDSYFLTSS